MFVFHTFSHSQNINVTYQYTSFGGLLQYDSELLITEDLAQFKVNFEGETFEKDGTEFQLHGQHYIVNYDYDTEKFTEQRQLDEYQVKASWPYNPEWTITDETKTILGYTVRKATKTNNMDGTTFAWFTTDIPVEAGPFKYAGLPGLILEFYYSNANNKCVATEIDMNSDKTLEDISAAFEISKDELKNLENNKKAIKKRIRKANR